jgi:hypothetical protein
LIFPASKDSAAFKAGANNATWNAVASRVANGRVRIFDLGIINTSDVIEALLLEPTTEAVAFFSLDASGASAMDYSFCVV